MSIPNAIDVILADRNLSCNLTICGLPVRFYPTPEFYVGTKMTANVVLYHRSSPDHLLDVGNKLDVSRVFKTYYLRPDIKVETDAIIKPTFIPTLQDAKFEHEIGLSLVPIVLKLTADFEGGSGIGSEASGSLLYFPSDIHHGTTNNHDFDEDEYIIYRLVNLSDMNDQLLSEINDTTLRDLYRTEK